MHASIKEHKQTVFIATGQQTNKDKIKKWQDDGYEVLITGSSTSVEGKPLISALSNKNYRHLYLIAGPKMLHTMINDLQLNNLYLSYTHQLIGGEFFRTKLDGPALNTPALKLESLFYDESSTNTHGQFFSRYTCNYNINQ